MVSARGKKKQEPPEAHIIADEYPEYVLLELKHRLDYLHFSMLVLQKAGADRKKAAKVLAPFRKAMGRLFGIISKDAEKTISKINSIRPNIIVYERPSKILHLDPARAEAIIRKEKPNIMELKKTDPAFARSVSRLLGLYEGYYLGMVSQDTAPDETDTKGAATGEFIKMLDASAPRAKKAVLITGRKNARKHLSALRKRGFAVRSYFFADLARVKREEARLKRMSRLSWLSKSSAKAGLDQKRVKKEFLHLASLFGVSRV